MEKIGDQGDKNDGAVHHRFCIIPEKRRVGASKRLSPIRAKVNLNHLSEDKKKFLDSKESSNENT